jgi:hypothetical protein
MSVDSGINRVEAKDLSLKYLFIAILLGMVVGPLLAMRPSAGQKKKIALRNTAVKLGMTAHFSDMPVQAGRLSREVEHGIAYRLNYRPANNVELPSWRLLNGTSTDYGWEWDRVIGTPGLACRESLREMAARMPATIRAVDYSGNALSVYWQEQGTEDEVQIIFDVLNELKSLLDKEIQGG